MRVPHPRDVSVFVARVGANVARVPHVSLLRHGIDDVRRVPHVSLLKHGIADTGCPMSRFLDMGSGMPSAHLSATVALS